MRKCYRVTFDTYKRMATHRKKQRVANDGPNPSISNVCKACDVKLSFERFRPRDTFGKAYDSGESICRCDIVDGIEKFQSWYRERGYSERVFSRRSSVLTAMTAITAEQMEIMVCYPKVMERLGKYCNLSFAGLTPNRSLEYSPSNLSDDSEDEITNPNILVVGHCTSLVSTYFGAKYMAIEDVKHRFNAGNRRYDTILVYHALCRAKNSEKKLRALKRSMVPDGRLIVVEYEVRSWSNVYSLAFFDHAMNVGYGKSLEQRLNMYPLESWKTIMDRYFTEVKVYSPKGCYREFIGIYTKEI